MVVVELRGRGFLPQQARRLIGIAVLVQRGDLPADAFDVLTRRDVVLQTPLPPDLSYFAGARYGILERRGSGDGPKTTGPREATGDDTWDDAPGAHAWLAELRSTLVAEGAAAEWIDESELATLRAAVEAAQRRAAAAPAPLSGGEAPPIGGLGPTPRVYETCLESLRAAHASGKWPTTTLARSKLIRPGDDAASFTLSTPADSSSAAARGNALFPALADAVFELETALAPDRPPSTRCAVNRRAEFAPHVDSGSGSGQSTSMIVGLGDYVGGALCVENVDHDVRYAALEFDGWHERHWTLPFGGERFSLVYFTPAAPTRTPSADDRAAALLAEIRPGFQYRPGSSDSLAILEVLGTECYGRPPPFEGGAEFDWSPRGRTVLDGGAHVGAFAEYALANGAATLVGFEPEPANAALFRSNHPETALREAALTAGSGGTASLVLGKDKGAELNTWRHALEGLSHYADGDRISVDTVPFDDVLEEGGFDFVKLDIEGAEMAILSKPRSWQRCQRLIFEWSFTKDPALAPFLEAIGHLRAAGFAVAYDGRGTWDAEAEWPGRTDALVFAARD